MMFSTKAEYGVRVMVELARHVGAESGHPIPVPVTVSIDIDEVIVS